MVISCCARSPACGTISHYQKGADGMQYPYLLFDADNTLFDFDAAERQAYANVCRTHGLTFSKDGYALYRRCNGVLWRDFDRGLCTKEFLLTERFRRYLDRSGQSGDPSALNRTHLQTIAASAFLLPGALELCQALAADHEMYIITNGVESSQRSRFRLSPLVPCFKDLFISEAIGSGKPSRAYFDYVFQAVPGLTPQNGLVIGDSLTSDIQGANNAGLACCWFNPRGLPRPEGLRIDYEVRTLEEILPIASR